VGLFFVLSIQTEVTIMKKKEWAGFMGGIWEEKIDVRDFININIKPYLGDDSFLEGPSGRSGH
jgi:formate C-acetyltransferase